MVQYNLQTHQSVPLFARIEQIKRADQGNARKRNIALIGDIMAVYKPPDITQIDVNIPVPQVQPAICTGPAAFKEL